MAVQEKICSVYADKGQEVKTKVLNPDCPNNSDLRRRGEEKYNIKPELE